MVDGIPKITLSKGILNDSFKFLCKIYLINQTFNPSQINYIIKIKIDALILAIKSILFILKIKNIKTNTFNIVCTP